MTNASHPARLTLSEIPASACPVNATTGIEAVRLSAFSRRVASQPSITGNDKSIRMMSGARVDGALQRLHAIAGLDDVEAREFEIFGVHLTRIGVVVNQQHTRAFSFVRHLRPFNGSVNVKVEPRPSWLRTVIRPSSICARRRQIDRPRPVPP